MCAASGATHSDPRSPTAAANNWLKATSWALLPAAIHKKRVVFVSSIDSNSGLGGVAFPRTCTVVNITRAVKLYGNQMPGFHGVLTAGCRMLKKFLTSGTNRARNVNNATKLHDAATMRIHLVQMDRPLFKSRYVATVSGA